MAKDTTHKKRMLQVVDSLRQNTIENIAKCTLPNVKPEQMLDY